VQGGQRVVETVEVRRADVHLVSVEETGHLGAPLVHAELWLRVHEFKPDLLFDGWVWERCEAEKLRVLSEVGVVIALDLGEKLILFLKRDYIASENNFEYGILVGLVESIRINFSILTPLHDQLNIGIA
jgi:hypothetical protein